MAQARPYGFVPAKRDAVVPDQERYAVRRDLLHQAPNGTPVAYSTDGDEYAPFRGEVGCMSRTGRPRAAHEFDGDGSCLWCDARKIS